MGGGRDVREAFKEYERLRLGPANRMVFLSRQTSRLVQSENRWLYGFRVAGIRLMPKSVMMRTLDATLAEPAAKS